MEAANTLRFRNALVFLRHQLRGTYACRPRQQQCRTNVNTTDSPIRKGFWKDSVNKFINQGLGDMKNITHPKPGLMKVLEERGFIGQFHGKIDEFTQLSDNEVLHMYAGADPTAQSLHLGHLMVLMPMIHCMLHGHRASFVVGIATARIGDPSDRAEERTTVKDKSIGENTFNNGTRITDQLSTMLKNVINWAAECGWDKDLIGRRHIKSNLEWFRNVSIIDFMQIAGHRARVGEMMSRKSVTRRMESKEGLSYAEFSYQLVQAMDYWHLFSSHGVRLQIGGSDQWGNITAGCDLINRLLNEATWIEEQPTPTLIRDMAKPYGLTVPLLTTAAGEKFSKSSGGGNVWLSGFNTPPFALYQYLLNRPDDVMEQWLKWFTIMPLEAIAQLMAEHNAAPERRLAQKRLAYEVVSLVHSSLIARKCIKTTSIVFGIGDDVDDLLEGQQKRLFGLTKEDVLGISAKPFWQPVLRDDVLGQPLEKVLTAAGITPSNTQSRTLVKSGGLSIGPHLRQVKPADRETVRLSADDLISETILLVKVGKNNIHVVNLESQETIEKSIEEHEEPRRVLDVRDVVAKKTARQRKAERKKERKRNLADKNKRLAIEKRDLAARAREKQALQRETGLQIGRGERSLSKLLKVRMVKSSVKSESEPRAPSITLTPKWSIDNTRDKRGRMR
ncbi:tyrosyl-tRNA synthetase [Orbilia brochopaga]|uniref:Tyrosine--tRNA ligase n=1 Tax=Orbilia brochopaga TaxID=3140254 RepID=A0AAV9UIH4_9PEZI